MGTDDKLKGDPMAQCIMAIKAIMEANGFQKVEYLGKYNRGEGYLISLKSPDGKKEILIRIDVV